MARCSDSYYEGLYTCGGSYYEWYWEYNATNFRHHPSDPSKALIDLSYDNQYAFENVIWSDTSKYVGTKMIYNGVTESGIEFGSATAPRNLGCDSTYCGSSGNKTVTISPGEANVGVNYYMSTDIDSGTWEDLGSCDSTLPADVQVSPPTGLTVNLGSYRATRMHVDASVAKWSDNNNIKGTPYTSHGGRNWNWRAELANGSTILKAENKNTGETKNTVWDWRGALFPINTPLTLTITASNEFQQTAVWTTTITILPLGYIVTDSGNIPIVDYDLVESVEAGGNVKNIEKLQEIT